MVNAQRVIVKNGPKHLKQRMKEEVGQRRLWLHAQCCTSKKIEKVAVCVCVSGGGNKYTR